MKTNSAADFDVIIVGAGATGAWAAKELTELGLHVCLLEAGDASTVPVRPQPTSTADVVELKKRHDRMRERQRTQSLCYACTPQASHLFVDDVENPYSTSEGKPFIWIRGRQVGGRLWTWAGHMYRMSDFEFKAASRDGHGMDWPICHEDLSPHYDRIERFLGVSGTCESIPNLPDGQFRRPGRLTSGEARLKRAVETHWPERKVIMGRGTKVANTGGEGGRRGAESPHEVETVLDAARHTGRLEIRANAIASQIIVGAGGKAAGVEYINRDTRSAQEVTSRAVMLCASTIESTRLLLNSTSARHPDGLANSSGLVGCHLMDHLRIWVAGVAALDRGDDANPNGIYLPQFRNAFATEARFLRGYGIQGSVSCGSQAAANSLQWTGRVRPNSAPFWMAAFGEMLSRRENRITVNPASKDAWGVPVAHFECTHSDNEVEMVSDALATLKEMAAAAGFEVTHEDSTLHRPGLCVHEVGTARMGSDPANSVLNKFNQSWDVGNLFVTDGACFVSQGYQNPTLTMMALAGRASAYLAAEMRRGGL